MINSLLAQAPSKDVTFFTSLQIAGNQLGIVLFHSLANLLTIKQHDIHIANLHFRLIECSFPSYHSTPQLESIGLQF